MDNLAEIIDTRLSSFEKVNEEQHKNIIAKLDYSISIHDQILRDHEKYLNEQREEIVGIKQIDESHTKAISYAKGIAGALGVIATIVGMFVLFIPH